MKKLFAVGVIGLLLLEIANVYFIMPMPGSQRMRSIDMAYAIYGWRWPLRVLFGAMILAGVLPMWRVNNSTKWFAPLGLILVAGVTYAFNFTMSADHMFLQPTVVTFNGQSVTRSPTTGRYATDAGLEFDHELGQVTAVRDPSDTACPQPARQVTLDLIEPFSGQRMTLQLVSP